MSDKQLGNKQSRTPRLALDGICKVFPDCQANDNITLSVLSGEIHALLGENGAGKSTLVKIVYGLLQADSGQIRWNGKIVTIPSPAHARRLGIGMVFQHFSLFETLTVAENIALGINDKGPINQLATRVAEVAEDYGLEVDPHHPIHALSVGERQRVEIIRCLLQNPSLIIMDEPTSVLTPQESSSLFKILRRLASEGRSILYISHRLEEIQHICDTATILRGGRVVHECDPRSETVDKLAALMVGNEICPLRRPTGFQTGAIRLTLDELGVPADGPFGTAVQNACLVVHAGEVLGIAGVAGNGQRELMQALSGEVRALPQSIRLNDYPIGNLGPKQRRALGIAVVPDERIGHGAVPEMTLAQNALLTAYRALNLVHRGWVRDRQTRQFATDIVSRFRIIGGGVRARARSLSGGNLQKFIIGREILQAPQILIAASPTWGVDAGAAVAIRQSLMDLAGNQTAVLIVSQDLEELLQISDRITVISDGQLSPSMTTVDATPQRLGLLMAGVNSPNDAAAETQ